MRIVFGPLSSPSASRGRFFYGVGFVSKRFSGRAFRASRIFRSGPGFPVGWRLFPPNILIQGQAPPVGAAGFIKSARLFGRE